MAQSNHERVGRALELLNAGLMPFFVREPRDTRNRWAHQQPFTLDDTYRAFDSIQRLLQAISAPEAAEIDRQKQEVLRLRFEELARREQKKAATLGAGHAMKNSFD